VKIELNIPEQEESLVTDAICDNHNYESYRKELQNEASKLEKKEITQAEYDLKQASIGPALDKTQWMQWRIGLWVRGQVFQYQRTQAEQRLSVTLDNEVCTVLPK